MTDKEFIDSLGRMQRKVMSKKLESADLSGATIGFSSMARWKVSRHIPILSPSTSLMIAHSAPVGKTGIFGASYDHRVLNGNDVAQVLSKLTEPPLLD